MTTILDWAAQTLGLRSAGEKMIRLNGRKMPYLEIKVADQPKMPLIIGIHGFGANEQQMQTLVNISPDFDHTYIAPRALHPHPTGGYMWFDIEFDGQNADFNNDHVAQALDSIDDFIQAAIDEYDADPDRVVFLGYSQGGMLAFPYLLRHGDRVAAVAGLAGSFSEDTKKWQKTADLSGKSLFIGYGTKDPLVQPQEMFKAKQYFAEMGVDVMSNQYAIPHVVSQEEVSDLNGWLKEIL
ncbi:MAG: alpha/beta fold hydrolase [Chloroflexota bacterium]